jgi:hypothetical protein
MLRYYLATADHERITVRHLCLQADSQSGGDTVKSSAVDSRDARTIVQAFIQFLSPPLELSLRDFHKLDIATILFEFTYDSLRPSEMQDLIPDMMRCALARAWLEFDAEQLSVMEPVRHGFVRRYVGDMCHYIR